MRIFKYWSSFRRHLDVDGVSQSFVSYGGSNVSIEEAKEDAKRKLAMVERKALGELTNDETYEVDIVEEIIHKINDKNIVTRNRYGALILNSKNLMFIDIDDYVQTIFDLLFHRKLNKKEIILKKINKSIRKKKYSSLGFRVYETFKGYRIIVLNKEYDPRSVASKTLMKTFEADYLYKSLCERQNCYRARLTPKPFRIKHKGMKVIYPNRTENEQLKLTEWLEVYDLKSSEFSTCRLVLEYGRCFSNKIVKYHDKVTGVKSKKSLA